MARPELKLVKKKRIKNDLSNLANTSQNGNKGSSVFYVVFNSSICEAVIFSSF
jgi:hypothetical protein